MRIYFDHNATTPVDPAVLEAMLPWFAGNFGNASSIHGAGQEARAAVETARDRVARLVGAKPSEIVFTGGGTEADNLAIAGSVKADHRVVKHVITSRVEHHAVLETCQALERQGIAVTWLPVSREGLVELEDVQRAIRPETVLISVMHANNELGVIEPVEEIGAIAREAGVLFHTDAVQSMGKTSVDVNRIGADLLSLSGHKIHGPKGVGALYVRNGTRISALLHGGQHERGLRPGTENVPCIVGLGKAAELARMRQEADGERISALRDRLEAGILAAVSDARVNGSRARRLPNTSNITIAYAEGESLVIALDLEGLACSTGAACSSGAIEPSHVLTAIGLTPEGARCSLRISLGRGNTDAEVARAVELIPRTVARLRELSPLAQRRMNA
jgi:cysteine desulfurase